MIPATPKLHPRCHLIPDPPGFVLRHGSTYLRVRDQRRAERFQEMVQLLDGRTAEAVLSGFGLQHLREGMQILEELQTAGVLVDNGTATPALPDVPAITPLHGYSVTVTGTGSGAERLTADLLSAGATLTHDPAQLNIVCPRGAQLSMLENFNTRARGGNQPWMPALRLGDELIAGPVFEPRSTGCFSCFVLRWLGMARSIPSELAYFRWLREGAWELETLSDVESLALSRHTLRVAAGYLSGSLQAGSVSFINVQTGEAKSTRLVPHPACPICRTGVVRPEARTQWSGWQSARPGPRIEELAARLEEVVSDHIGLVGRIEPADIPSTVAGAVHLASRAGQFALPRVDGIKTDKVNSCAGLQRTEELAGLVAIVEGVERYCGVFPIEAEVSAPYSQVADVAMLPTSLPLFSEAQYAQPAFPFQKFNRDQPLSWVWGYSFTEDAPRLVPKSVATYGPTDDKLVSECSSGVAARSSLAEAALRGLFEMVERDAFMIFWLNRLAPPVIDLESLPAGFARSAVEEIRAVGHEPVVVNITTDLGIPVFLAITLRRDGKYPALVIGAGCSFHAGEALDKAFYELLGAVRWHLMDPNWKLTEPMEPDQVRSLNDHHLAYSHPAWLSRAEFLWSGPSQRFEDISGCALDGALPGEQLASAVDLLRRHNLEFIAVDLTTPDVAATGIRVVRAVVPGLQPIGFGRHAARLGGRRLYEAPCRMGYRSEPLSEQELNRDPHCFP